MHLLFFLVKGDKGDDGDKGVTGDPGMFGAIGVEVSDRQV